MEHWLPIGFDLPGGYQTKNVLQSGFGWQILKASEGGKALIVKDALFSKWIDSNLITKSTFQDFTFGDDQLHCLYSSGIYQLTSIESGRSPSSKNEAFSFVNSLSETRKLNIAISFQDALYVEKISRLLPTFTISTPVDDDVIVGYWLTGGVPIPAKSFRKLSQAVTWLAPETLGEILIASGSVDSSEFDLGLEKNKDLAISETGVSIKDSLKKGSKKNGELFVLPGRKELTDFFNEHIIDIINNENRYKKLGIEFPSALILYGPPGTGKTYAVERLTDFLGWPMFEVDATSIASPYIHETSKKIAEIFKKAIDNSPSVLVIDEMDAFLSDRESGTGQHRVEEVAEFLRQIPEATKNKVLIIAMTNRIDMIDPAILRRGRFDHVIKVDYASEEEILNMLLQALEKIPKSSDLQLSSISKKLAGRPLSDSAFVIREAARLAAKNSKDQIDQISLEQALESTPERTSNSDEHKKIGFI